MIKEALFAQTMTTATHTFSVVAPTTAIASELNEIAFLNADGLAMIYEDAFEDSSRINTLNQSIFHFDNALFQEREEEM